MRVQVWNQVRDQVWDQVWDRVGASVMDQVRDQVSLGIDGNNDTPKPPSPGADADRTYTELVV